METKYKILYILAFGFLPYSIPCWIIGTGIYFIGGVYKTDYSGDDVLILIISAPISLPCLLYNYVKNLF